ILRVCVIFVVGLFLTQSASKRKREAQASLYLLDYLNQGVFHLFSGTDVVTITNNRSTTFAAVCFKCTQLSIRQSFFLVKVFSTTAWATNLWLLVLVVQ